MKNLKYPELAGEMARHGDTQRTLAKVLGLKPDAVWRRVSGRTEWTIDEVDKICEYYGKDYYQLFKRND
jgi:plasmid maintenance system antidote protein VapI